MTDWPASDRSRRDVLRYGLVATAATAWAAPTIMTFRPLPASAGSEAPGPDDAPTDVAASGAPGETGSSDELASTGSNLAWVALAGNAAVATGAAAVYRARSQQAAAGPAEPTADDLRPS